MRRKQFGVLGGLTHGASGTEPLSVGDLGQRRVQAVDVIRRGAGVAAQQLATIFANSTELHVVVLLLVVPGRHADAHLRNHPVLTVLLEVLKVVVLRLPLDPLFFLTETNTILLVVIKALFYYFDQTCRA